MLKYRLQAIFGNQKDMSYRVIFKRYWNSKNVNLEYFNNYFCFVRNKVTREVIKLAAEHELLFTEYKIQTETGDKNKFTHFKI